jgi:phage-related protein
LPLPTLTGFPILRDVVAEPIERVAIAQFDDGYEMRRKSGINSSAEKWTIRLVISNALSTDFNTFIDSVGKHSPFYWTSPRSNVPKTWFIDEYSYEYKYREDPKMEEWIWTLKIKQTFGRY